MKQQSIPWLFVEIFNFEFPIDFFSNFIKVAEGQWYWWNKDFILEFVEQNWSIRTNLFKETKDLKNKQSGCIQ